MPPIATPIRERQGPAVSQSLRAKVEHAAAAVRLAAERRRARLAANPETRVAREADDEEGPFGPNTPVAAAVRPSVPRTRGSTVRKRGRPSGVPMNAAKKMKNAYMDEEYVFWASDEEDLNPDEDFLGKMAEKKKARMAVAQKGSPAKTAPPVPAAPEEGSAALAPPAAGTRRPESLCSTWIDEKDLGPNLSLQQATDMFDYDPLNFIRCHAKENNPRDAQTKVWRAAFIPGISTPLVSSRLFIYRLQL